MPSYDYRVLEVLRVVDADTVDLRVDLGFHLSAALRFRLAHVDAPELRSGDLVARARAREAQLFAQIWLGDAVRHGALMARTYKADSFGRWLAELTDEADGRRLDEVLVAEGFALPWPE